MKLRPWVLTVVWIVAAFSFAACTVTGVIAGSIELLDYENDSSLVGWLEPGVESTFERGNEGGGGTERWLAVRVVPSQGQSAACVLRVESGGVEVGRSTRDACTVQFASYGRPYVVHVRSEDAKPYVEVDRLESREAMLRWRATGIALLVSTLLGVVLTLGWRSRTTQAARRDEPNALT